MKYKRDRPRKVGYVKPAIMYGDTPPAFADYLAAMERGPIAHVDLAKFTIPKARCPLADEWWLNKKQLIFKAEKRPGKTHWNDSELPDILRGTRLTISGAYTIIELTNMQNRFPHMALTDACRLALARLEEIGVLPDADAGYREARASRTEIRFDMLTDIDFVESLRYLAVQEFPTGFYFTAGKGTLIKIYLKSPWTMRFEITVGRRPFGRLAGTSKEVIQAMNIESVLRSWQELHGQIWPRIRDHQFYEDLPLDHESLFKISERKDRKLRWI